MPSDMQSDQLVAWLRLERTPGVGRETARKLLAVFGLPNNIFTANYSTLCQHVGEKSAQALLQPITPKIQELADNTQAWLAIQGNHLLTLADANYPACLLEIPDPPLMLYAKGRLELLGANAIAIVGSRNASTQGLLDAEKFAEAIGHAGLTIVSGLAAGIDTAAHRGGLRTQASTIAVIGTGADIVYPAKNHALAHQIAEKGCLLSEYPLGMPAIAHNFPRRNRIISGLARGVLVVEAALQSGSLITARTAAEQGRDVFAIPGSIHSALAKGCHQLIKQGAKLVESAQDVLEELRMFEQSKQRDYPLLSPTVEEGLLAAIGFSPVDTDVLASQTKLDAASLASQLLVLELDGLVERLADGRYQRLQ